MPLPLASGTGRFAVTSRKSIRLLRQGCTNRPFFHIVVVQTRRTKNMPVIEQLGSYDPMPNFYNEKLVALNLERIKYWIGMGAHPTKPVEELFGLSGFYPIHPRTYMNAWRNRKVEQEKLEQEKEVEKSETQTTT